MIRTQRFQLNIRPELWEQYQEIKEHERAKGVSAAVWIETVIEREHRRVRREKLMLERKEG